MFNAIYQPKLTLDCLASLFSEWRATAPEAGVFVLLPEAEEEQVSMLQSVARAYNLPMLGAIFPALLTRDGFQQSGAILLQVDPCPPWILVGKLGDNKNVAGVEQIAAFVKSQSPGQVSEGKPTLFLTFDGLLPNISTILHGLYTKLEHDVSYVGVNAGSESFQPVPCLFDHHQCIEQGVIAMLLGTETQFAVNHGYPTAEPIFRATSSVGNRIDMINDRPALEIYQQLVKQEFGIDITSENFYQYAVHYPLGLTTVLDVLVRIPVGLTEEGGIYCVGEIPTNSMLKLLLAPRLEESKCIESLTASLGRSAKPLLTFYCAGRRMHFGDSAEAELRHLQESCNASDILGALTLGEIGTDFEMGFPQFHNAALVCAKH
jgi:hypothetical protein